MGGGGVGSKKNPFQGQVWIFSGMTQFNHEYKCMLFLFLFSSLFRNKEVFLSSDVFTHLQHTEMSFKGQL